MKNLKLKNKRKNIWSEKEKEAWMLPEEITVSEWTDKNRYLDPKSSAESGQWRTSRTPYLQGIMDAFNDIEVEEITIKAATQLGKTESMYNMIGYAIDQDPGPALLVMPRESDAKSVSYNRIKPMLELSETLQSHMPILKDDITKLEYHLDHMILYFVGSNSPAGLAQRPIRYLFLDEIDKFPKFSGKEADPIKLATERTRTFWNRKIIKVSTPTTRQGYIYREYERSDRRRYYIPCPHCGEYQVLVFSQVKWPEGEHDAEKIRTDRLAWYECIKCKEKIFDKDKSKMLENGVWVPEGAEITPDGKVHNGKTQCRHRGFWLSALYSPWLTFSEIASEFLRSKNYIALLMNFVNSWLAEIWEEKAEETKPEKLIALAGDYIEGTIPQGVLVLTGFVDVQKDHFYALIRGWGYNEESWLIRACRLESWEDVISMFFKTNYAYKNNIEKTLSIRMTCIDSGYRTNEVYEVCRKYHEIARATKGHDHLYGMPYKISHLDRDSQGNVIKGGLTLFHLDTSYYKDKINRMVHAQPGDPGQWHLFENISNDYLNQFCAEHKILMRDKKTGRTWEEWKLISTSSANHYLDCEVGAIAAADMIRVSALRPEGESMTYRPHRRHDNEDRRAGKGWINRNNSGKWIR